MAIYGVSDDGGNRLKHPTFFWQICYALWIFFFRFSLCSMWCCIVKMIQRSTFTSCMCQFVLFTIICFILNVWPVNFDDLLHRTSWFEMHILFLIRSLIDLVFVSFMWPLQQRGITNGIWLHFFLSHILSTWQIHHHLSGLYFLFDPRRKAQQNQVYGLPKSTGQKSKYFTR